MSQSEAWTEEARRCCSIRLVLVCLTALTAASAHAQAALGNYPIDSDKITVSGISSGGYMAVQLGVAYSSLFSGVGVFAAGPYGCADTGAGVQANITRALGPCMGGTYSVTQRWWCSFGFAVCPGPNGPDPDASVRLARQKETRQEIDSLNNVARQRVFLLAGEKDKTVNPVVVDALASFYQAFVPAAQMQHVRRDGVAHTFPTEDFSGGNACSTSSPPFVSDCNYDGAMHVLSHLYGKLTGAAAPSPASLLEFDQRPFFPGGTNPGMADKGYVYVPASCSATNTPKCALHVALHGCQQTLEDVGKTFVEGAGYNRWAEANRVVVLYPQIKKTEGLASGNPKGCWDWWGYSGNGWDDKRGAQMKAIVTMVDRLRSASP